MLCCHSNSRAFLVAVIPAPLGAITDCCINFHSLIRNAALNSRCLGLSCGKQAGAVRLQDDQRQGQLLGQPAFCILCAGRPARCRAARSLLYFGEPLLVAPPQEAGQCQERRGNNTYEYCARNVRDCGGIRRCLR
ncbi:hypothetical protein ABPG77_003937 [Micractinium sp. CCAP 211/92]